MLFDWAIIAGVAEEMLFRGLILGGFKKNYTNRKAVIISSLFFTLYHLNPLQFFYAFILGLFAAWLCVRTDSILLSVYLHMYHNLLTTVFYKFRNTGTLPGYYYVSMPFWFYFTGLVLFVIGIILLKKGFKKLKPPPVNATVSG